MDHSSNIININIYDQSVYAEYGYEGHELIEDSLVSTVETLAATKPIRNRLKLVFHKKKTMKISEERFVTAYTNSIKNKVTEKNNEIKRCLTTGIILLFVGLAVLCFDVFVAENLSYFLFEFFNIFAWVFCWAAVEIFTIHLVQLIIDKRKYKRLLSVEILFKVMGEE